MGASPSWCNALGDLVPQLFFRVSIFAAPSQLQPRQYIRGCLPLCSCLTTKESYNWWITRRELGFRHQISEAKYQKMSVANIWKHSGEFRRRTKWLRNFADKQGGCEIISQLKADFAALRNWPSTWSDLIPMGLTSSFQLRFVNRLKHWIVDFLIFKTKYSMYKLDFRKYSKSG